MFKRKFFHSGSLRLSYIDFGGCSDNYLVTLHGHYGNARMFANLASHLENWNVISLDQRGHGWSSHESSLDYSRDAYVEDIYNLIQNELEGRKVALLGHSLGGVNAFQFAARYPELVQAMIIEDIGTEISGTEPQMPEKRCMSIHELRNLTEDTFGKGSFPYFAESAIENSDGWGFRFHHQGIVRSRELLNGVWWKDWQATDCPVLLLHGLKSWATRTDNIREMAVKRQNVIVKVYPNDSHTIHDSSPDEFNKDVGGFLEKWVV